MPQMERTTHKSAGTNGTAQPVLVSWCGLVLLFYYSKTVVRCCFAPWCCVVSRLGPVLRGDILQGGDIASREGERGLMERLRRQVAHRILAGGVAVP